MADSQPQNSANPNSRKDYLKDSDYFMAVACLVSKRSKDPSRQVGACIVNQEGKIVGIGHNQMPNGCDDKLPWSQQGEWIDQKYPYVCHAELNAIMNRNSADVKGCTMYVTLFPCNECAKLIIQAGFRDVVYLSDAHRDKVWTIASKRMLDLAGIPYSESPSKRTDNIIIDFKSFDHPPHDDEARSSENVSPTDAAE